MKTYLLCVDVWMFARVVYQQSSSFALKYVRNKFKFPISNKKTYP